jgi:cobalt-precorrin 5A hydrolase/precorrin-3B C17-methyltransferase
LSDPTEIICRYRDGSTPVAIRRYRWALRRAASVTDLAQLDSVSVDVGTIVAVGSPTSRVLNRPLGSSLYTPGKYSVRLPFAPTKTAP